MQQMVVDTSVLIDLRKACSLPLVTKLPNDLMTTNLAFGELKHFTADQINELIEGNLRVIELPPERINRLNDIREDDRKRLSTADASLCMLADSHAGSILLTGDKELRNFAEENGLEVHGTIWLFRQFFRGGISTPLELCSALQKLIDDQTVRLPYRELSTLIEEIGTRA